MKYLKALLGAIYYVLYCRTIDLKHLLKGKRVAIIGAANSTLNTDLGDYIDGFDYVIRINKAPYLIQRGVHLNDIGRKTDILFHSFYENEKSGGGKLNIELYNRLGINYLVNPINSLKGKRVIFNFYKKYLAPYKTFTISKPEYDAIQKTLEKHTPTIGFCALMQVLECEYKELYITGFTFFRTPFSSGYRDEIQQPTEVQKLIKNEGHHNIDLEFTLFSKKIRDLKTSKIKLDTVMEKLFLDAN